MNIELTHKEAALVEIPLHDLLNDEGMSLTEEERHDAQVILTKINEGLQIC